MRRAAAAAAFALAVLAAAPAAALAHAQLEGTSPARGAVVAREPARVVFRFSETVEGQFGAVRVFDARAQRVDDGHVAHPNGIGSQLGVGLKPGLPKGTYTATYRVISADGHPVEGGMTFSIGRAGAAPPQTIDQLIGASKAGTVTRVAAAVARGVTYLATALSAGVLAFLWLCWRPGLASSTGADRERRRRGAEAFAARTWALLLGAVAAGILAGAAGIALEAAEAGGTTFWSALDATVIRDVLQTRFGEVWGIRVAVFALLGSVLLLTPPPRVAALSGPRFAPLALLGAALVVAPALEGHSSTLHPTTLLELDDAAHVAAMSAWLGGLAMLVLALPRATRALEPPDRARLLAAVAGRFSAIALAAVVVLAVTGTLQAIPYLTSFGQLVDDGYGREILAKILLLLALAGLGAVNRQRTLPRLHAAAGDGAPPGAAGRALRDVLRAEVALLLVVLGVTAVLVDGVPPVSAASGPFNGTKRMGAIEVELSLDPARTGANDVHLYLFRARDGAPYAGTKELTVTARQDKARIGPVPVPMHLAGPGHYTGDAVQLVPGGTWTVTVTDRYSEFDEVQTQFQVPIR